MIRGSVLFVFTDTFLRFTLDFNRKYVMAVLMKIVIIILKVLMLIRQMHQKGALFATIGIFQIKDLSFKWMFAMGVTMY